MTSTKRKVLIGVGITILVLLSVYTGISVYYNSHFFPNTVLNGVKASGKTAEEVQEAIKAETSDFVMTLVERDDQKETISGKDIGLEPIFDSAIPDELSEQNGFAWPVYLFKTKNVELTRVIYYDQEELKKLAQQLNCMTSDQIQAPTDATISEYDNGYEIVKEDQGNTLNTKKFLQALDQGLTNLTQTVNLEKEGCYEEPKVTSDSDALKQALDTLNKYTSTKIEYAFGETLGGDTISTFLTLSEDDQVTIDEDKVMEYVKQLASKYNTIFSNRTFQTSYGKTVTVPGGDYGWWMNKQAEVDKIVEEIKDGKSVSRDAVYLQEAASHTSGNDYGNTYVEVNLTAQHMYYYKNGKKMMECDVVTGNTTLKRGTPAGTYGITYKESDATLTGEDYESSVKYWMPFNGNIGLHDADWQTEFGGQRYLTNGSHGCVNMPPKMAKKLFSMISKGDPVIVYELPGTETDVTSQP